MKSAVSVSGRAQAAGEFRERAPVRVLWKSGSGWFLKVMVSLAWVASNGCAAQSPAIVRTHSLSEAACAFELTADVRRDPMLQSQLEALDERIAVPLGIPPTDRAFGVVDLAGPRVAMIRPDEMFYGASLPKIVIVWAFLVDHPEAVAHPPGEVEHDLEAIIKRSDNELAAKYSQIVGLDRLQSLLESPEYRFYDREHGGGLWCGKHYGLDQPRRGDPLRNLSHAATVRQTLRYYLLLEQDRLGSPLVCRRLREIFGAPWAEFHDDYFVAGLRGMNLNMIRKNGLWEDWHLDSARIELPDRPILLAGMVHHPRGPDYLSKMARAVVCLLQGAHSVDAALAESSGTKDQSLRHVSIVHDAAFHFAAPADWRDTGGFPMLLATSQPPSYESAPVDFPIKFNQLTCSWNIDVPAGTGFRVALRVGRRFDGFWSPWLVVGEGGTARSPAKSVTSFDAGQIDVDYFRSAERYDRAAYRVFAVGEADAARAKSVRIRGMALCASDSTGLPDSWTPAATPPPSAPSSAWMRRLPVPFRSQKTERPDLAGRICSPTSLAMVLEYYGIHRTTQEVADACYDPVHQIYGNWPRNIQAAYELGVHSFLTQFTSWSEVEQHIAASRPIIASIRFERDEAIPNAPYARTDGHLIVLCGFDGAGGVYVNDPAVPEASRGMLTYQRRDLERVWFTNTGGIAYVLFPPGR